MSIYNGYGKRIETQIRPSTYPIAVRLLKSEDEIPQEAKRPVRDWGKCISTCQAFSLSRRFGETIAQLFKDHWCPEPVIGFGLAEPPEIFTKGLTRYPDGVKSTEAGSKWAMEFPRLRVGEYIGHVSAPLTTASFEPDVAVVYCNSAQLLKLLLGIAYEDGKDVPSVLGGHSACVYAVVPSLIKNQCWISVPCRGDRGYAGAQDDEMIFTVPRNQIGRLADGLEQHGTGSVPTRFSMSPEYKLSTSYAEAARAIGMRAAEGGEIKGYSGKDRKLSLQYR